MNEKLGFMKKLKASTMWKWKVWKSKVYSIFEGAAEK